jgi:hypothetical protein
MGSRRHKFLFGVVIACAATFACATWYSLAHSSPSSSALAELLGTTPAETAESQWVSSGPNTGGFRAGPARPSLYQTSWHLRLRDFYGLPLPAQIDRARLVRWLQSIVANPDPSNPSADGLPSLEITRLAAQALIDLHESVPPEAAEAATEAEVDGGGYTFWVGAAPTWAAASAAVELLSTLHRAPVDGLPAALLRDLPGVTRNANSLAEVSGELVAAWEVADILLPISVRSQWQGLLDEKLRNAWASLTTTPPSSGLIIASLEGIWQVAKDNAVMLPPVPASFFAPATLPGGYLEMIGTSDPQITYEAAVLGRPMPPALGQALAATANASGWSKASDGPDPEASYRALAVLHALGDTGRDGAMRRQADAWLAKIRSLAIDQEIAPGQFRTLFFVLALERELGAPDDDLVKVQRTAVDAPRGWSPADLGWAARGDVLLGVSPATNMEDALSAMAMEAPSTMGQAFGLLLACQEGMSVACGRMSVAAETFRVATEGFRWSADSSEPDLRSIAMAAAILGQTPGADVLRQFASSSGPSLYPTSHSGPNLVDVDTAFFMLAASSPNEYRWTLP